MSENWKSGSTEDESQFRRAELPLKKLGRPGMRYHLVDVGIRPGTKPEDEARFVSGSPGKYNVVFTLQTPGHPEKRQEEITCEEGLEGDSYVQMPVAAKGAKFQMEYSEPDTKVQLKYYLEKNASSRMSKVRITDLQANDFYHAEQIAFKFITPFLSTLSFEYDVPVQIAQVDSVENSTGNRRMSYVCPYPVKGMEELSFGVDDPEKYGLVAIYREGLNSNSPFYSFLCFFKIIEAVYNRRARIAQTSEGKANLRRSGEVVPDDAELRDVFAPAAIGKRFKWVSDKVLRPKRDEIAHALVEKQKPTLKFSSDNLSQVNEVFELGQLSRFIARKMMLNEFGS